MEDINTGAVERSEAARARRLAGATVVGDDVIASTDYMMKQPTFPTSELRLFGISVPTLLSNEISLHFWRGQAPPVKTLRGHAPLAPVPTPQCTIA